MWRGSITRGEPEAGGQFADDSEDAFGFAKSASASDTTYPSMEFDPWIALACALRRRVMLRDYLTAVTEQAQGYLSRLTDADMSQIIDTSWNPPVTRGVRLVSVFADALEHGGQAAYVTGMR